LDGARPEHVAFTIPHVEGEGAVIVRTPSVDLVVRDVRQALHLLDMLPTT
jgi:hypothetical protein